MASPLLTPKQVARAIGVSESSLKRWCDRGTIETVKTAGGHRRIPLAGILAFLRDSGHAVVRPEVLGLPAALGQGERTWERSRSRLSAALVAGDEDVARQVVFDLYLARHLLAEIADLLVHPVLIEIGRRWQCGEAEVYQERRACEIANRIFHELRALIPEAPANAPLALGATPAGDQYRLPTLLVELVLREAGWQAISLGSNLPFSTLAAAIARYRPRLFWLSVSHLEDEASFVEQYNAFYEHLNPRPAIILGGHALTEPIRKQLTFAAHGDNLRQLVAYVESLTPPSAQLHRAS